MPQDNIAKYSHLFQTLHVKTEGGYKFPNKAILLISIMELIRCGYIANNKIYIDSTIKESFNSAWMKYVNQDVPSVWTPFWHMKNESFWHFLPKTTGFNIDSIALPGQTAALSAMRSTIQFAYLDTELFDLMQDSWSRTCLFDALKHTFLE